MYKRVVVMRVIPNDTHMQSQSLLFVTSKENEGNATCVVPPNREWEHDVLRSTLDGEKGRKCQPYTRQP